MSNSSRSRWYWSAEPSGFGGLRGRGPKALVLTGLVVGILGVGAASAAASVTVFVGYADNAHSSPPANTFPTPWAGSPNTSFMGAGPVYDAGAVRLENTGSTPVTVNNVTVNLQDNPTGPTFNLWGPFTVPAATASGPGEAILTQTAPANFDTSEFGVVQCTPPVPLDGAPTVSIGTAASSPTFSDNHHVLDTGGFERPTSCVQNESTQWTQIGSFNVVRAGAFTCRASALRVGRSVPLVGGLEPVVANGPDSPCATDAETGIGVNVPTVLTTGALNASTVLNTPGALPAAGDSATASSSVASLSTGLLFPLGLGINATVLRSTAAVTCTAGAGGLTPTFTGSSTIATLTINGQPTAVVSGKITLHLGLFGSQLVDVWVNRQIVRNGVLIQRALEVDLFGTPLLIAAESKVDTTGNPCGTTTT